MAKMHSCPKCGSDDLEVGDCGYSSFNAGWVKCRGCKFELKVYPCGCFPEKEIRAAWKRECHDYPIRQRALKKLTTAEKRALGLEKERKPRLARPTRSRS
jgi:hypothetical protein